MPPAAARSAPQQLATPLASRPSRLAQVQRGRKQTASRVLIYADGGIGKTSLAASMPRPLLIDINNGSAKFDVARYTFDEAGRTAPSTFDELLGAVHDVGNVGLDACSTLVLDVLSDIEALVWAEVMRRDGKATSIVDGNLGYNKGYEAAVGEWRRLAAALEVVWLKGVNIALLDHFEVKKIKNPAGADYGRGMPKIHPLAGTYWHTWCDFTFLLEVEAVLVPDNADARKEKKKYATSDGRRLLHARPAAEWMAKSRPELPDPLELPERDGWSMITAEIRAALVREIEGMAERIDPANAEKVKVAMEAAGDDDAELNRIFNKLADMVGNKKGA